MLLRSWIGAVAMLAGAQQCVVLRRHLASMNPTYPQFGAEQGGTESAEFFNGTRSKARVSPGQAALQARRSGAVSNPRLADQVLGGRDRAMIRPSPASRAGICRAALLDGWCSYGNHHPCRDPNLPSSSNTNNQVGRPSIRDGRRVAPPPK